MPAEHDLSPAAILHAADSPVATRLEDETVILDAASGRYFGLEGVGSFVWGLLQEPIAFSAVVDATVERFDVDPATCTADLRRLMAELHGAGLVEIEGDGDARR